MGAIRYLLDTHTLLWATCDNVMLSNNASIIIENTDIPLFVSAVNVYDKAFDSLPWVNVLW
jgi:PIN domain nuclease of toxin-antitoxin system